ncbi:MAG: hypothetical protein GTN38_03695 [Candidatus Aenigmarchaeota archaeon]|nr:hypothetical protein [Candidatus Aenigmarchaeota archaeon]NIP40764.1 hypothetical protein [Candidatus Aenigmarchaeota archaeon]NIQ18570.1 hypothetical protein [Candidatus Aenigmarchaeota archaeon]NIS73469.1 hypothetical protein [Candidatus Aenigmarchaeota archaeon]
MTILVTLKDVLKTYKSNKAGYNALKPYVKWFPLKPTAELAGVVADLICDGHLQGEPKWRVDFTFKLIKDKNFFREFVKRFYSCEGTCWGGESPGIGFEMWKEIKILNNCKEFLESIRFGLKRFFDIDTTEIFTTSSTNKRKDGYTTKPVNHHPLKWVA